MNRREGDEPNGGGGEDSCVGRNFVTVLERASLSLPLQVFQEGSSSRAACARSCRGSKEPVNTQALSASSAADMAVASTTHTAPLGRPEARLPTGPSLHTTRFCGEVRQVHVTLPLTEEYRALSAHEIRHRLCRRT